MRIVYFTDYHNESFGIKSIGDVLHFLEFMQHVPKSRDRTEANFPIACELLAKVRLRRDYQFLS